MREFTAMALLILLPLVLVGLGASIGWRLHKIWLPGETQRLLDLRREIESRGGR